MKVKRLIELLREVDQELEVYTTYDTWCCTDSLDSIIVLGKENPSRQGEGVFLTGTDSDFIMDEAMKHMSYSAMRLVDEWKD